MLVQLCSVIVSIILIHVTGAGVGRTVRLRGVRHKFIGVISIVSHNNRHNYTAYTH
jgi:hypothetical protein